MNTRWSRIFILQVLLTTGAFAEPSGTLLESSESSQKKRSNLVLTIVGGVIGGLCIILLLVFLHLRYRARNATPQLEDGLSPSESSASRRWFARFGRYRRDDKMQFSDEKDSDIMDEKILLSMPRYMRANSAFAREMPKTSDPSTFQDRPLVASPAVPRSAHVAPRKTEPLRFQCPTSAPLARSDSIRSIEHLYSRQAQVSPRPTGARQMVPSPLGNGSRKRDILPNLFRFGSKTPQRQRIHLPPGLAEASPDELARRMVEKQRAVDVLEAKSRVHKHHAHSGSVSSVSSVSTSASCDIDVKIQKDLAELRDEVKVLNQLLPNSPPPSYGTSF